MTKLWIRYDDARGAQRWVVGESLLSVVSLSLPVPYSYLLPVASSQATGRSQLSPTSSTLVERDKYARYFFAATLFPKLNLFLKTAPISNYKIITNEILK
jgi:hypothetical protein